MEKVQTLIANLSRKGTIIVQNRICKAVLQLLIQEDFVKVKKLSNNRYKIQELSFSNIVVVNRRPIRAEELLDYATTVCPSISGSVLISTDKGIMTHQEA